MKIYNESTYQRIYNEYSKMFIDTYCNFRRNGHTTQEALIGAKIFVQNKVALEFEKRNRPNYDVAVRAYTNLKNDSELIEKAIRQYRRIK